MEKNSPVAAKHPTQWAVRRRAAALFLALLTLLGVAPSAAAAPAAPPAAVTPAAVDRYVRDYMARTGLPGAVVAVTKGNRIIRTAGYGHTAGGARLTARSRVPVASVSKSFTALAVLQLADAGRVDLDAPVRRYLPEFRLDDERARRITTRQLLNQTSGMEDSTYPDMAVDQPHTLRGAVAAMRHSGLATAPGTRMRYHNSNYVVAARLVEVVSGQPFADYLTDHVFRPLGMRHTRTVDSTTDMPERARGHVRAYGTTVALPHPRLFVAGSFGVVTTADDLARWLMMQNSGGLAADGRRIVSARAVATMHTPGKATEHTDYGMGWWLRKEPGRATEIQHNGQLFTRTAIQTLLPGSGYGIAVAGNTGFLSGEDSGIIARGLSDLAQGRQPTDEEPFTMTADLVLGALTLLVLGLGTLGVVRSRRWARRAAARPWWRPALRLLPYAAPLALCLFLSDLVGWSMRRAGPFWQVAYAWPALTVWVVASALAAATVVLVRIVRTVAARRAAGGRTDKSRDTGVSGAAGPGRSTAPAGSS
ncbi:serine hydrolase domain-containing protein [Streptomyces niger]|uniref:serine hydrolase domain-containing protein n=1 Tax=Streptomyces niger TaxID=66373 RepID=UPI000AFCCE8C|nr:serine hydrolase domain-containing protein [Streptomyces niger]